MKRSGPDSLKSWVIAIACCFINMMMFGMARLSGVLFVASVPRFNVGREKASFPYTFSSFMRNTSGPLVGLLGHKFGVRVVTTFGCILGAIGAGTCYFAESIDTVTVLWGAIFGLGFGLGNILLPVSINQYFDKHRATASGISFSGACVGSFILPPIVELLINTYGLSGTYLFLSGFILNCVPAALLLKKPSFEIQCSEPGGDYEKGERQSIVSGMKVKLYTVEDNEKKSFNISKSDSFVSYQTKDERENPSNSFLSYEERIKRLSTQTLLSDYSIRMSSSEPLDVEQIIENSKGRRKIHPVFLESESLSVTSQNTDEDLNSGKDDVFEQNIRSSSVQYETPAVAQSVYRNSVLSSESLTSETSKNLKYPESYENYGFQKDTDNCIKKESIYDSSNFIPAKMSEKTSNMKATDDSEIYFNCAYQKDTDNAKMSSKQYKNILNSSSNVLQPTEWSKVDNFKVKNGIIADIHEKSSSNDSERPSKNIFSVLFDPMFILIALTNAIYSSTFVCMITIIVDYARDIGIGNSNEKYILMTLSVGDLIGRLGLGWITDRGYMTTIGFTALCFFCQGVAIALVVWSNGFISMMTVATLYGLSEASLICIFPVIIAQYIEQDKQAIAIPSSHFLSGPLCLAVAPLIGYFRDDIGSYDYIFYGLAALSGVCCLSWLFAPCLVRCRKKCES